MFTKDNDMHRLRSTEQPAYRVGDGVRQLELGNVGEGGVRRGAPAFGVLNQREFELQRGEISVYFK